MTSWDKRLAYFFIGLLGPEHLANGNEGINLLLGRGFIVPKPAKKGCDDIQGV